MSEVLMDSGALFIFISMIVLFGSLIEGKNNQGTVAAVFGAIGAILLQIGKLI